MDYLPKRVDLTKLSEGDYYEMLNIVPIEGLEVALHRQTLAEVNSQDLSTEIVSSWLKDISSTQMHKVLAGVAPLGTAMSLGHGVSNLVLLPVDKLLDRKSNRPSPGVAMHGLLVDSLGIGSKVCLVVSFFLLVHCFASNGVLRVCSSPVLL